MYCRRRALPLSKFLGAAFITISFFLDPACIIAYAWSPTSTALRSCANRSPGGNDNAHIISHKIDNCKRSDTGATRRNFLTSAASAAVLTSPILIGDSVCHAAETSIVTADRQQQPQTSSSLLAVPNLQCLADLPPITPGCARIYLCRHGQTENNRLRKVQGARVDPSLNAYGAAMASRIGMALSYLSQEDGGVPTVAVHSQLTRARETAQIAAKTLSDIRTSGRRRTDPGAQFDPSYLLDTFGREGTISVPTLVEVKRTGIRDITLPSLGEVDFGTGFDGANVELVKAGMYATYASWSVGAIDKRMDGGGESGREVLGRAASALSSLADIAKTNGGRPVLAVSHSTYLRTLLGAVTDTSLVKAVTIEQKNGCINVLDVNVEGATTMLGPKSGLFGGSLSQVSDFEPLILPETHVIRTNEYRHLEGIAWPTS